MADSFFDTNVLLYLMSADTRKADTAEAIIAVGGHLSVQVLNEFTNVARRNTTLSWAEIADVMQPVRQVCTVHPLALDTHDLGRALAERYALSFYDALIVASAQLAGCARLYSEDFQHGQRFGARLQVENPFLR